MSAGVLIIADDLSGAADCAAAFAGHLSVEIRLTHSGASKAEVVAFDLDSRRLGPAAAARANAAVLDDPRLACKPLYKKIDSTLRGNVASEIAALQAQRGMALIAPAFPTMGRTTLNGVQCIDGLPVDQTDAWRNEKGSGNANLCQLLTSQGLSCATLGLEQLSDHMALSEILRHHLDQRVQALVCDAETDAHLDLIASASVMFSNRLFWVGSAGLAARLPDALSLARRPHRMPPIKGPVLTVVGSMSHHSLEQAGRLAIESGQGGVANLPALLLEVSQAKQRIRHATLIAALLAKGQDVTISIAQHQRDPANAMDMSKALASLLTAPLGHAGAVIVTGGETARSLLAGIGITRLALQGELAPGIVLSTAERRHAALAVVTKAGSFGRRDTLLDAWSWLRSHIPQSAFPLPDPKEQNHA